MHTSNFYHYKIKYHSNERKMKVKVPIKELDILFNISKIIL